MNSPSPKNGSSGRALVAAIVLTAAVTLVMVIVRERNKKLMFAMYADVHNLVGAQETFFNDSARFSRSFPGGYTSKNGSTVDLNDVTDTSFVVRAQHDGTNRVCAITFVRPRVATEEQMVAVRVAAWKTYDCK